MWQILLNEISRSEQKSWSHRYGLINIVRIWLPAQFNILLGDCRVRTGYGLVPLWCPLTTNTEGENTQKIKRHFCAISVWSYIHSYIYMSRTIPAPVSVCLSSITVQNETSPSIPTIEMQHQEQKEIKNVYIW